MRYFHLLVFLLILSACQSYVTQEEKEFADSQWFIDSLARFEFQIEDIETAYKLQYDIAYSLKEYPYHNLYLQSILQNSKGDTLSNQLQNFQLVHPKTGEPYGNKPWSGDIFHYELEALPIFKFPKADKYTLSIQQYMRNEPLFGIPSIGIYLQKINN